MILFNLQLDQMMYEVKEAISIPKNGKFEVAFFLISVHFQCLWRAGSATRSVWLVTIRV